MSRTGHPSYLEPSTVEWCDRCRCKTWHVVETRTGERSCEWAAQHDARERLPASVRLEEYPDEGTVYDAPPEVEQRATHQRRRSV